MTNKIINTFFKGTVTSNKLIDTFLGGLVTSSEIIVIFLVFLNEITK
jgi:hypothetical protein